MIETAWKSLILRKSENTMKDIDIKLAEWYTNTRMDKGV